MAKGKIDTRDRAVLLYIEDLDEANGLVWPARTGKQFIANEFKAELAKNQIKPIFDKPHSHQGEGKIAIRSSGGT
jgi:hypothetical protein